MFSFSRHYDALPAANVDHRFGFGGRIDHVGVGVEIDVQSVLAGIRLQKVSSPWSGQFGVGVGKCVLISGRQSRQGSRCRWCLCLGRRPTPTSQLPSPWGKNQQHR